MRKRIPDNPAKVSCNWPGCTKLIRHSKWACNEHWLQLPQELRLALTKAYVPGQEEKLSPSLAYMQAGRNCLSWIISMNPKKSFDVTPPLPCEGRDCS